ncbi:MAG: hypothetical protein ACQERZ_03035 [Fusobacteriota bacterium]
MKKVSIVLFLSIALFIYSEDIDPNKYREDSILNKKVYFPKNNREYVEDLLKKGDNKSYLELALVYGKLDKKDSSKIYLKKYLEQTEEIDYIKISKIYNIMGDYNREIKIIDNIKKDLDIEEKRKVYKHIRKVITENNLNKDISKFKLTKVDKAIPFLKENDYLGFYGYYKSTIWNDSELEILKRELLKIDLEKRKRFQKFYFEIASKYEKLEYFYNNIKGIEDKSGFYNYFEKAKELDVKLNLKDDFETLYFYKWKKDELKFKKLYEQVFKKYLNKENNNELYKLNLIQNDIKLLYNLAIGNKEYIYEFVTAKENQDVRHKLIENLDKSDSDKKYAWKLKKENYFKVKEKMDFKEKLEILDELINLNPTNEIFQEKLEIIARQNDLQEDSLYENALKNYIFNFYPEEKYVRDYINILVKDGKTLELYENLYELPDKGYFFEICNDYGYRIPEAYKKQRSYIDYLMDKKKYSNLLNYKERLTYEDYKKLLEDGQDQFEKFGQEKYPFKKEFIDLDNIKYFFFGDIFTYSVDIDKILNKENKTDAEKYFLSKYYKELDNEQKSLKYIKELYDKYKWNDKITRIKNF